MGWGAAGGLAAETNREYLIATAIGVCGAGYVFLTNVTASTTVILLHVILLWLAAPAAIVVARRLLPAGGKAGTGARMAREVAAAWSGLSAGVLVTVVVISSLLPITRDDLLSRPLITALVPVYGAYAFISVWAAWVSARQRELSLELTAARLRWAALAARIRPHFLFNSLNCLEELTVSDPAAARLMVGRLARLYRNVLEASERQMSSLRDELELADDYLRIEMVRFGPRLSLAVEVAPSLLDRPVPTTVLLTLAENAVKHGVERTGGPAGIRIIAADLPDGRLAVSVESPAGSAANGSAGESGDGFAVADGSGGYGLTDVRERLRLAGGSGDDLSLSHADGRVCVRFVVKPAS